MAAKQLVLTPRYSIQHSRFTKQDGWRLWDLSLSLNGNIAVTGYNVNTYRTCIDVYTNVRHSDSRDKPKIFYSKEFEKYTSEDGWDWWGRFVSFYPGSETTILCGLGDKLEVIDLMQDRVIKSRKIKLVKHGDLAGEIRCMSVRETEIFIGFRNKTNKITVYDVIDVNEIKSIILQGIQDGYFPSYMTSIADRIFVCVGDGKEGSNEKSLIFEEKNGRILSELTKPTDTVQWYVMGLALNITLNVIAVAWTQTLGGTPKGKDVIVFYSLLSENNCSFLIVEVEFGVIRIRISDRGDRIVTGNRVTQECKVHDMAVFLTYHQLRQNLASQLQVDDCVSLINYFALPKDQSEAILNSGTVTENLLSVLEETSVLQPSYVDRLIEAFKDLNINSSCYHLVDFYKRTRMPATSYDKFLATLSAHLVASLPSNLCDYFNITDENKTNILSSQNPGLSLLLSLDKIGVIKESDVAALEPPFTGMELVQAVAMIHEYQSIAEEEKTPFLEGIEIADDRKREFFVLCLQRKIKSWYETMTPVPWRKSCKWSVSDLFVGSGLILTDSKTKRSLSDVDEKCKVESKEIFSHERLKDETRIVLEGDPGCGKTMLMSQLAYDWSQGQLIDIKLLILLPLKFVQQRTLAEAIKLFYVPEDKGLSITDIEKFLDDKQNPAHLLLDGLEEYSGTQKQEKSEVRKVITRKKYPFCKVLISSRSDFAKDLPKIPMLKLGIFGEKQRSSYIEKLFPKDSKKQMETKQIIDNFPIIQDLCSVPLLFVLAVHNVGNMGKAQIGQLDRVTPFVRGMVDTLCPVESLITKTQELALEDQVQKETSLEELAFNGLCKGSQQLYWQKEFFDEKVQNSREWIDSGVLVIEESSYSMPIDKKDQHAKSVATEASAASVSSEDKSQPSGMEEVAEGQSGVDIHSQMRAEEDSDKDSEETASSDEDDTTSSKEDSDKDSEETASFDEDDTTSSDEEEINSDYDEEEGVTTEAGGSIAKHVPLQVRFLHKIIQEWFAAKYFSSMISRVNLHLLKKYLYENLPLINPADLHHVLRFTCALYLPSCHIIIKHLFSYRNEEGDVPEYIMNCIFLCLAEYTGDYNPNILEVLSDVCMENILIHCDDSRLLQQSKVMLLEVASSHQIPIKKVQLLDVVRVAEETGLTLNSDVTLDVLDTLQVIEVSRWDQTLTEKDYSNLVAYIATSKSIHTANLSFPSQPPVLQPRTLEQVASRNLTVHWQIGGFEQTLGASKGIWTGSEGGSSSGRDRDERKELLEQPLTETELIITNNSATVTIPGSKVVLNIPANALPEHMDQCLIKMRIIPRTVFKDPEIKFCSYSSVVIEILPNKLLLRHPAQLMIPHCLLLKENKTPTAKVFMSHHETGCSPSWEEHPSIEYRVERTYCAVWLKSFCWVTIMIDDKEVLAKKLILYTWGKTLMPTDDHAEIAVGYYPDLEEESQFLRLNKNPGVVNKTPFTFMKEGCHPLCWSLEKFPSNHWKLYFPEEKNAEIAFKDISASFEIRCTFVLEKTLANATSPMCIFQASQVEGQQPVTLSICPQQSQHFSSHASGSRSPSRSHQQAPMTSTDDVMNSTFRELQQRVSQKTSEGKTAQRQKKLELDSTDLTIRFLSKNLAKEWRAVCRGLKVTNAEMDQLKEDYMNNTQEVVLQSLLKWRRREPSGATFGILSDALRAEDRGDLAEAVLGYADLFSEGD